MNVFSIGYSLYGLSAAGLLGEFKTNETGTMVEHVLKPTECLIFSSLISAVDPVAVLAIFEEIHVHLGLYFLVFGESLFNDGVTVVLYNTMNALLNVPEVGIKETFMAILSFFFVAFGGAVIGAVNGVFASYITTFTKHVRIVEPLIIFSTAYFAFLQAELVHWSGIISIIAYGITVKKYGFQNLGRESYTTVKYAIKTLASTSDCIIFLYLGMSWFTNNHVWDSGFIIWSIIFILLVTFAYLRYKHREDRRQRYMEESSNGGRSGQEELGMPGASTLSELIEQSSGSGVRCSLSTLAKQLPCRREPPPSGPSVRR